jgi:hypothetical protein
MNHPSWQELTGYAGRTIDDRRGAEIDLHIAECARCRDACRALEAVEGALHRLPVEHPSAGFTRGVLSRVGLREETPLWWLFLRNFAPILVAGVVAAAIIALGAGESGEGTEPSAWKSLFDAGLVGDAIGGAAAAVSAWTGSAAAKLVPITVGGDAANLTIFLVCLFAGIGLLDRYVLQPMMRRRH